MLPCFIFALPSLAHGWQSISTYSAARRQPIGKRPCQRPCRSSLTTLASTVPTEESSSSEDATEKKSVTVDVTLACGFAADEMSLLTAIVQKSCRSMGFRCNTEGMQVETKAQSCTFHGPTGRILVLRFPGQVDTENLSSLNDVMASYVDHDLYSDAPQLQDPFLLRLEHQDDEATDVDAAIAQAVNEGELQMPLAQSTTALVDWNSISWIPSQVLQVDGAFIHEPADDETSTKAAWDTSSVAVFDGLVSDKLRKRLAQVISGGSDFIGEHSPDPKRWEKGGLSDKLVDDEKNECDNNNHNNTLSSYGLTYEAIHELCFQEHEAITEMETIISKLFSDFIVTRLPEAVFGQGVTPLTANAPVAGDFFEYHIDADPFVTPPSLWTDVYGRYPNRCTGKPRFVSLLVYLNEEWHDEWGGPTRFLDVSTDTEIPILPRPGRCVVMDQDVSHSVTAPSDAAGRPRYSLVWKLSLHPRHAQQDMRDLTCGRTWPMSTLVGSAKR